MAIEIGIGYICYLDLFQIMVKVGRPKAEFDLPEGWQDEILSLYSQGASDVEIKAL